MWKVFVFDSFNEDDKEEERYFEIGKESLCALEDISNLTRSFRKYPESHFENVLKEIQEYENKDKTQFTEKEEVLISNVLESVSTQIWEIIDSYKKLIDYL